MRFRIPKICIVVMAVLIILSALCLSSCGGKGDFTVSDDSLRIFTAQYAAEYTVVSEDGDHSTVSVTAPDFTKIAETLFKENGKAEPDADAIINYANSHPECSREYLLELEKVTGEEVEKALLDRIAYDLMVTAIEQNDYSEGWDAE